MQVIALKREPSIRIVDRPPFSPEVEEAIAAETRLLAEHPHQWNGPQLMALEGNAEEVIAYHGSYSHYRAWQRLGERWPGLGPLGVGVFIANSNGLWLWQRTSPTHSVPSSWGYGVFGGVSSDSFRRTALLELQEELGLDDDDFLNFGARGLLLGSEVGAYVVYRGMLSDQAAISPNGEEVSATLWVRNPLETLTPIDPSLREIAVVAAPLL